MPSNPSPRKRGAPLGNANAMKHGFYSSRKSKGRRLSTFTGLADEIALLRLSQR